MPGDEREETCRVCGAAVRLLQFPALRLSNSRDAAGDGTAGLPSEGGRCFSHPDASAESVCEGCGRFMCRDCDTIWSGEHLCLNCIHDRREVRREEGFVSRRFIYDNAALAILAFPIIFFYPFFWMGVFTGPMAVYYLVRHRKASRGFVPRSAFRTVAAWILSVATIAGTLGTIALLIYAIFEIAVTNPPGKAD